MITNPEIKCITCNHDYHHHHSGQGRCYYYLGRDGKTGNSTFCTCKKFKTNVIFQEGHTTGKLTKKLFLLFLDGKEFEQTTILKLFGYSLKTNMVDTKLYKYVQQVRKGVWRRKEKNEEELQ